MQIFVDIYIFNIVFIKTFNVSELLANVRNIVPVETFKKKHLLSVAYIMA